jgi:hypothetical protein
MTRIVRNNSPYHLALTAWLLVTLPLHACAADGATHLDAWLGAGVTDFDYEEYGLNGASLDWEEGYLPGLNAGLRLTRGAWLAETALTAWSGSVDYTNPDVSSETDEDILDGSAITGRGLFVQDGRRLSLYAGFGYRYWQRDIRSTPSAFGLDETYRWWYGILGVRGEHDLSEWVRVRADLQLTRTIDPTVKVRFASGYDAITLDPGEANGVRAAVTLENRMDNGMTLFVSPWYEYWKLGRSNDAVLTQNGVPVGTVFEPRSKTHNLGINAGVRWRVF